MSQEPTYPMVEIEGITYTVPPSVARHIDELQDAWERAEAHANYLASELRWFCGRVDRGEVQSTRSYQSFKAALASTGRGDIPEGMRDGEPINRSLASYVLPMAIGAVAGFGLAIALLGLLGVVAA